MCNREWGQHPGWVVGGAARWGLPCSGMWPWGPMISLCSGGEGGSAKRSTRSKGIKSLGWGPAPRVPPVHADKVILGCSSSGRVLFHPRRHPSAPSHIRLHPPPQRSPPHPVTEHPPCHPSGSTDPGSPFKPHPWRAAPSPPAAWIRPHGCGCPCRAGPYSGSSLNLSKPKHKPFRGDSPGLGAPSQSGKGVLWPRTPGRGHAGLGYGCNYCQWVSREPRDQQIPRVQREQHLILSPEY